VAGTAKDRPAYLARETLGRYSQALGEQIEWLERFYPQRQEVIRDLVLALLCRENVVLLGPPGAGKTSLANDVLACFYPSSIRGRPDPARVFSYQCSAGTRQEDLVGPYSATGLLENRYDRLTSGKLPEAEAAILDEIFKPSVETLDVLLEPLNARRFYFGTSEGMRETSLQAVIAMSNEIPDDMERGAALWDRFLFRVWVDDLAGSTREEFLRTAVGGQGHASRYDSRPAPLSPSFLEETRADVSNVTVPDEVIDRGIEVFTRFEGKDVRHSTRRLEKAFAVVQAHALFCGRASARISDLRALTWLLWDGIHPVHQFRELADELLPDQGDNPVTILQELVVRANTDLEEYVDLAKLNAPTRDELLKRTAVFDRLREHASMADEICSTAKKDTFYEQGSESLSPREVKQIEGYRRTISAIQEKAASLDAQAQAPPDWLNHLDRPAGAV
jgi:MoxR-like ATPase